MHFKIKTKSSLPIDLNFNLKNKNENIELVETNKAQIEEKTIENQKKDESSDEDSQIFDQLEPFKKMNSNVIK